MRDPLGKLVSVLLGAAIVVVFGYLGLDALRDYRTFDDTPTRTTLLAAVNLSATTRRWVSLESAPWRCDQLLRNVNGGAAFLPATADDGSTIVARFDVDLRTSCEAVVARPLVGILEPMTPERAADLRAAGLSFADGARLRTLDVCASCGKGNARIGLIVCPLFVLLGLTLYPLRRAYQSFRGRTDAALHAAIHAPQHRAPQADRTVRAWGAVALIAGVTAFAVGKGWVAYGVIPVRAIAVVGMLMGVWMTAFPASYRAVAARAKRR